jgi:1-pyrroline-5-carboxylate dehydrogenase
MILKPMSASSPHNTRHQPPLPVNEPVRAYAPGSAERASLKRAIDRMVSEPVDIPIVIGGREIRTGRTQPITMPFDHRQVIGRWHVAEPRHVKQAIQAARQAAVDWQATPWPDRAAVLLRAAEMLATRARDTVNAATMLGQAKTAYQAEIDAACELIDFWRFNVAYAAELYAEQPVNGAGVWNTLDYRPLEGFVYAVSPFNFTAIAGNLCTAPALMGGVSIWKPASSAMLSAFVIMQVLREAGLPPGVINFLPGDAVEITKGLLASPDLAGIHFTGSTAVFQSMWRTVGERIETYRTYPRLVGETGGKDFLVLHPSADVDAAAVAIVRGAFEYQGQKCSAASRLYIPQSRWTAVRDRVVGMMTEMSMGDVRDFRHFLSAVIDRKAFDRIRAAIAVARRTAEIVHGGGADDRRGYFIEPTLVRTDNPGHRLMREEIFGPVVTAYVYRDRDWAETLALVDRTSPYGLTGSVFATDRAAIAEAAGVLRHAAGNFYVNDKPTGAVVGQQPFGGARASGTNDKAGSKLNLTRWVSARSLKETLVPPRDYRYPFMGAE